MVTDVEGIAQVLEQLGTPPAGGVGRARGKGRRHLDQPPANALAEPCPLRWVGPAWLAGPDMPDRLHTDVKRRGGNNRQRHRSQPFQDHTSLHFRNLHIGNRVRGNRRCYEADRASSSSGCSVSWGAFNVDAPSFNHSVLLSVLVDAWPSEAWFPPDHGSTAASPQRRHWARQFGSRRWNTQKRSAPQPPPEQRRGRDIDSDTESSSSSHHAPAWPSPAATRPARRDPRPPDRDADLHVDPGLPEAVVANKGTAGGPDALLLQGAAQHPAPLPWTLASSVTGTLAHTPRTGWGSRGWTSMRVASGFWGMAMTGTSCRRWLRAAARRS